MKKVILLISSLALCSLSKADGFVNKPSMKDATVGLGSLLDLMVYTGLSIGIAGLLLDVMVRNKQDGLKKALLYLAAFGVYLIIKAVFLNPT